jgi:FkbM family methyltransferase
MKHRLLQAGPDSVFLRLAFRMQAAIHGISMRRSAYGISLVRGRNEMILNPRHLMFVPFAVHSWDALFAAIEGWPNRGRSVLDFSSPGLHQYRRSGLSFYFPALAEDDCMDAYTAAYRPRPGDVVWDVGAHAGMTACQLAHMVGPNGMVYAFEPDETNFQYLLRNIGRHCLANVFPVKAALSRHSGIASFCMDGTIGAGLSDSLSYSSSEHTRIVETVSIEDACDRFGCVPDYIKLDIEGAELGVVAGALDFLRSHPIHLSIESNHMVHGQLTSGPLDAMLNAAGYHAWSSNGFGQRFTWAVPGPAIVVAAASAAAAAGAAAAAVKVQVRSRRVA